VNNTSPKKFLSIYGERKPPNAALSCGARSAFKTAKKKDVVEEALLSRRQLQRLFGVAFEITLNVHHAIYKPAEHEHANKYMGKCHSRQMNQNDIGRGHVGGTA